MKRFPLRKADIVLIVLLIAGALLLLAYGSFFGGEGKGQLRACCYRDGEAVLECPLSQEKRIVIPSGDGGENVLVIRGGQAFVESADCPGQDCVHEGAIDAPGEEIICLPHKLVIRIEGGEAAVDAVVR
ncbi:MAG: NusG domain II-containing protein [Lachnospiraceae bacterium]|nr:NusG domain II-containing protein [Lachnospiraceae bacterium]